MDELEEALKACQRIAETDPPEARQLA